MQKGIKLLVFLLTFHSFIGSATLSATSNKTIVGEKPSFTEEVVEKMTDSDLFGLTINGANYYGNSAVKVAPINLYQPIKDVIKVAPMRTPKANEYYDPDDDPFGEIIISNLKNQWYYTDAGGVSRTFTPSATDSFCNLVASKKYPPYKYVISADLKLSSQYGNPRTNDYTTPKPTKTYTFFNDSSEAKLCYAQTILKPDEGKDKINEWHKGYGFLVQSNTDSSVNFPQTGFYGARFQLSLTDNVVNDYEWKVIKGDKLVNISTDNKNKVNVNFTSNAAKNPITAWQLVVPNNGYEVIIEGTHKTEGTKLRYPFKIKKWFSTWDSSNLEHQRDIRLVSLDTIVKGCENLYNQETNELDKNNKKKMQYFYQISSVSEVSNITNTSDRKFSRQIGSLLSEWGDADQKSYPGSWASTSTASDHKRIWVTDPNSDKKFCDIHSNDSAYHCRSKGEVKSGVCTAVPMYMHSN